MKHPDEMTPEERALWRDALCLFKEYKDAGQPFGKSSEALKLWFDYGCIGRSN